RSVILAVNRMLLTLSGRCGISIGGGQRTSGRGHGRGMMIPCACADKVNKNTPIKAVNEWPIFIVFLLRKSLELRLWLRRNPNDFSFLNLRTPPHFAIAAKLTL